MGKKRAVSVRRIAERLMKFRPNGFTSDFEENKSLIGEIAKFPSRAARNKVAGYITRVNKSEASGIAEENVPEGPLNEAETSGT